MGEHGSCLNEDGTLPSPRKKRRSVGSCTKPERRPDLPAEDLAGIAVAARDAWQEQLAAPLSARPVAERPWTVVRARRPLVHRLAWGVAAAAVAAIGIVSWWAVTGRPAAAFSARVDRVQGRVEIEVQVDGGPDLQPRPERSWPARGSRWAAG